MLIAAKSVKLAVPSRANAAAAMKGLPLQTLLQYAFPVVCYQMAAAAPMGVMAASVSRVAGAVDVHSLKSHS